MIHEKKIKTDFIEYGCLIKGTIYYNIKLSKTFYNLLLFIFGA